MASHEGDSGTRAEHEALVRSVMELISAQKLDDVVDLMHDDLVFELAYAPPGFDAVADKAAYAENQRTTFAMFSRFSLEPTEFHPTLDPDGLIAEYRSDAEVTSTGKPYRNRYIGVFRFKDGKVVAWKEFHNADVVREAFTPNKG